MGERDPGAVDRVGRSSSERLRSTDEPSRRHPRWWTAILTLAALGVCAGLGAAPMLLVAVGSDFVDRPDPAFSALAAELRGLDGVREVREERVGERFESEAHAAITVRATSDADVLAGIVELGCGSEYGEAVNWTLTLEDAIGTSATTFGSGTGCPRFRIDPLVASGEVAELAPGGDFALDVNPENGLTVTEQSGRPETLEQTAALLDHSDRLLAASGLPRDTPLTMWSMRADATGIARVDLSGIVSLLREFAEPGASLGAYDGGHLSADGGSRTVVIGRSSATGPAASDAESLRRDEERITELISTRTGYETSFDR